MRGKEQNQGALFSYVNLESRIPEDHPLRPIKRMVDSVLGRMTSDFQEMYSYEGRPSIPPEQLLRALLIQILYSIRSERMLVEQLNYNLLFRWFVGLSVDGEAWHHSSFSTNRDRLLEQEISRRFFEEVMKVARKESLLSSEHFTIDGTFIEAWASQKSFKPKDPNDQDPRPPPGQADGRNPEVDYSGQKRCNETHQSTTDPDARLMRKGGEGAKLVHHGHVLTENRNGLVVAAEVTLATGNAEVQITPKLLEGRGSERPGTIGADKGYDQAQFVKEARSASLAPHVAQKVASYTSIDRRTTRHKSYEHSQRRRKMVEEFFGWMKTVGILRKARHRGTKIIGWIFQFTAAAYNLIRMRKLIPQPAL